MGDVVKKWFYEKNRELLESKVNVTFDEILAMSDDQFRQWVIDLRKTVVYLWDEKGLPPRVGYDEEEIIGQFNDMIGYPFGNFLVKDELTGEDDVIRNTTNMGNAVNQWFPTMMKTKINYSTKGDGKSIYDFFAKDELLDTFVVYASRHFKRDSFYHYSNPVKVWDMENIDKWPCAKNGHQFIKKFKKGGKYDYWFAPIKEDKAYTGYDDKLRARKNLTVRDIANTGATGQLYEIRVYEKGQKLFPIGLKAFRVSFCQYAVNFPPLTARYIYEQLLREGGFDPNETQYIFDPSAGWGGRIIGAMAIDDTYDICYIGTDPNRDHDTDGSRTKYHELADFFNNQTYRANGLFPKQHSYKIYQLGSEVIRNEKLFQKYKGKIAIAFTSPPYFAKEVYSQDPEQSCHKFGDSYASWRDGFLRPTIETCYEWLKPGGYIAWNIADAKFGKDMLPLEGDSCKILESLGMKFIRKWKMSLAQMPGANRVDDEGKGKAKNTCKVNGILLKYEPIYVYQKVK